MSVIKHGLSAIAAGAVSVALVLPAAAAPAKFDFWFGLSGDLARVVQELCGNFNKSQSDYEVVCTSQGNYDATLQNTIAAFRAGKQPTVVQVYDVGTATMMLSGAYYAADKLMEENGYKIDYSDYFPGIARYYATSKGEMLSFPFNSSTALLYWNKDAFAKIGKTDAPKTWEEAGESLKALKDAGYDCPMAINISANESWQIMEQFSAIHDQPIASKNNGYDGLDARLEVNKTKFVQYVGDLKKWYDEGLVKIKSKELGQDMVQAFAAGDCQMIMTSVGDHGTVGKTQKEGMSWDVAPLPVYAGTERKNSLVGGASLWVLSGKSADEYKGAAASSPSSPSRRPRCSGPPIPATSRHQVRLRIHEGQRLLRQGALQGPRGGHRQPDRFRADADHPRHTPRQLHADPRRVRQPDAGHLRQQGRRAGRHRQPGQERRRRARALRGHLQGQAASLTPPAGRPPRTGGRASGAAAEQA